MHDHPKGADDDPAITTHEEDDREQAAVLRQVLELHPVGPGEHGLALKVEHAKSNRPLEQTVAEIAILESESLAIGADVRPESLLCPEGADKQRSLLQSVFFGVR